MIKDRKKINFLGQSIYVGIDVHKKSWSVAICTEHRAYRPFTLSPPNASDLVNYLRANFPEGDYLTATLARVVD